MIHRCCEAFAKALTPCTDNEQFGPLISDEPDGSVVMGSDLPPVQFCPWCGAPIEKSAGLRTA